MNLKLILIALCIITLAVVILVILLETFQTSGTTTNVIKSSTRYVTEYSLPAGSMPNALLVDKLGNVWISTSDPEVLLSLDPQHEVIKKLAIEDASQSDLVKRNSTMVWTMLQDTDGKIWFSDLGTKSIWNLEPKNDSVYQIHTETGSPFQMKSDQTGKIWFTTLVGNTVGVVEKSSGTDKYKVLAFEMQNSTTPAGIFLQDDSVWVAGIDSQRILQYKIDEENGSVKSISLIQNIPRGNSSSFASPTDLLVHKNVVWLTEHGTSFLTSYNLDDGTRTRYPTSQNHYHTTTLPFWIRANDDPHLLWFNEHQGNKIGCFDLYNGTLTEYTIPSLPSDGYLTYPLNISEDIHDEKVLWFSEWNTDKVGVINGHVQIPFEITTTTKQITLSSSKKDGIVDFEINGDSHNSNAILLNASSSITPTAELGNLTARFSSNMVDLTQNNRVSLYLHDDGVSPGNYTLGISASDGSITTTTFLSLSIANK